MGSSFTNVDIHLIFHTKSNGCVMKEEDLPRIFHYIGGIIRSMSGFAFIVGGRPDHIHILTAVPVSMSLADFVRDVKSCTTKWIKGIDASYDSFSWQEGYGAFSVSISSRNDVINYILKMLVKPYSDRFTNTFWFFLMNSPTLHFRLKC